MATYDPNDPKQKEEFLRFMDGLKSMPASMRDKLINQFVGKGVFKASDVPEHLRSSELTAQVGAEDAEKAYLDLANKQWEQQTGEGLTKALGQTQAYTDAAGDFYKQSQGPSATSNVYGEVDRVLQQPSKTEEAWSQFNNYLGSDQTAKTPGMHEKFVQQSLDGKNPYWERLNNESVAKINQEMARRGHFDSGGAGTAIGNYLGAANAAQWREMGELTKSGQAAGMDRSRFGLDQYNTLGSFGQAADQEQGGRAMLRMGAAGQYDADKQARALAGLGALQGASSLNSGLTAQFYGLGGQLYGGHADSSINAGNEADQFKALGRAKMDQPGMLGKAVNTGIGWGMDYLTNRYLPTGKK